MFCQDVEDPSDYSATENTENPDYTENPDDTGNPDYTENPHDTESQGETENPEEPVDGAIFSGETITKQTARQIISELQI